MTETPVTLEQDGVVLHGGAWVTPQGLIDQDIASGLLLSLKGMTPVVLPELDAPPHLRVLSRGLGNRGRPGEVADIGSFVNRT